MTTNYFAALLKSKQLKYQWYVINMYAGAMITFDP